MSNMQYYLRLLLEYAREGSSKISIGTARGRVLSTVKVLQHIQLPFWNVLNCKERFLTYDESHGDCTEAGD